MHSDRRFWRANRQRLIVVIALLLTTAAISYPPTRYHDGDLDAPLGERQFLLTMEYGRTPDFAKLSLEVTAVVGLAAIVSITSSVLGSRARNEQTDPKDNAAESSAPQPKVEPVVGNDLTAQARAILRSSPPSPPATASSGVAPVKIAGFSQSDSLILALAVMIVTLLVISPAMTAKRASVWQAYAESLGESLPTGCFLAMPFWVYQFVQKRRGRRVYPGLTLMITWSAALLGQTLSRM